jgi:alkylated DNA nucleotide flippase Atl1
MMFGRRRIADWEDRLDVEVGRLRNAQSYREVTLNRIKHLVGAPNEAELIRALAKRVSEGNLTVLYRVVSPRTNASLATYQSPMDVPETILDESTGEEIDIDRYRNVEPVYVSEATSAQ